MTFELDKTMNVNYIFINQDWLRGIKGFNVCIYADILLIKKLLLRRDTARVISSIKMMR